VRDKESASGAGPRIVRKLGRPSHRVPNFNHMKVN
jgi:hypothetical protein